MYDLCDYVMRDFNHFISNMYIARIYFGKYEFILSAMTRNHFLKRHNPNYVFLGEIVSISRRVQRGKKRKNEDVIAILSHTIRT